MAAVIEKSEEAGWSRVITSFDREFVEALKREIPWHCRRWVKDDRAWWIHDSFVDMAVELCGEYFGSVDDRRAKQSDAKSGVPAPYRVLHLQATAPREVVKAAYRALTILNHPDRGGSHENMVEINRAFESINKEHGWK